jgi:GntR family transcriptional regulator
MQIIQQVETALRLGHLRIGDRLPKVKDAAASLAVNPNTVMKAYRELEVRGIAIGRQGVGKFISAVPETRSLDVFNVLEKKLTDGWLADAREAGLDDETILDLFQSTLMNARATPEALRQVN